MQRGLTTWGLTHRALFNAVLSLLWNLCLQLFTACASGSIFKKKKHYRYHLRLRQSLEEKLKRARAGPLTLQTVVFTLGTLSKHDFERCTSTGSEAFSSFICLDAKKFVLLSFFSLIKTICPGFWTHPLPNVAKSPLPVDVRRSKTLLLKLPFGAKSHVCGKRQTWICTTWPSVPCFLLWNSQLESDVCSFP